jgi:Uncharacterized protein conserved in bacteria
MAINRKLLQWSRTVHIYFSIALFLILVFFALTGITLNHATFFTGEPQVTVQRVDGLPDLPLDEDGIIADSPELAQFLREEFGLSRSVVELDAVGDVLFVDYRAPGRSGLLEIDVATGTAQYEFTNYGLIATLNDLHKARDTDVLWKWLIDISGVLLVLFSIAGFILLLPNRYRFKRIALYSFVSLALIALVYMAV